MRTCKRFDVYRHFKGGIYIVLDVVKGYSKEEDCFTDEKISEPYPNPIFYADDMNVELDVRWVSSVKDFYLTDTNSDIFKPDKKYVIYRDVYNDLTWIREYEEFMSEVDHEKYPYVDQRYRFELIRY